MQLHKQIERQGQKGIVLVLRVVCRYEQQQKHDDQICSFEIFRQYLLQKAAHAAAGLIRLWMVSLIVSSTAGWLRAGRGNRFYIWHCRFFAFTACRFFFLWL